MSQDTANNQARGQGQFAARLSADPYFSDITVLEQAKGVTENDIQVALSTLNEKGDKIGAIAIVLMPALVPNEPDAPGPEYKIRATVQVIVTPLFNDSADGTGKTAEAIALRVRQLLHRFNGGRGIWSFAGSEPIDRNSADVSYGVVFTRVGRDAKYRKLAAPLFTPEEGELPLNVAIEGPAGAEVRYTLDGSYPTPESDLYSAPLAIAEPATLCAVAYLDGWQPSDVALQDYGACEGEEEFP